jgi:membrane protease subunit HflK
MPWSNQGGGGSGSGGGGGGGNGGGQGPWGRGSGGQQPPNIEDMVRRGQDKLKSVLPGGIGGRRGIILGLIGVFLIWLASGLYRVEPDEQGVVLRFGAWVATTQPGLNYHWPMPFESALTPAVEAINSIEVGFRTFGDGRSGSKRDVPEESVMLTGDQNIIDIDFTVQWKIKDAGQFLFNIRDPAATVKVAAESAMREIIGRMDIQPALTEARGDIQMDTRALLQTILDDYEAGIEITEVQLQEVQPPAPVLDAFNDVQRALQDRDRLQNEAEAYRNDILPRARGAAVRLIQDASAYKEQIINEAIGETSRFLSIYAEYKLSKEVTRQRIYLETMEEVYRGTEKMIIDSGAGGGLRPVPYLPLPDLDRRLDRRSDGGSENSNRGN